MIRRLEQQELITIIKKCPACFAPFKFLPNYCKNCGYKLIKQKIDFNDNRFRPRYIIEITDKGISFVKELIRSYSFINSFFNLWNRHANLKSFNNLSTTSESLKSIKQKHV
jgi:predicted amidophosphoribosyltransferase